MELTHYQFKIEGVIIENPDGWQNFELRLKRDEDISGILVSSTNQFVFKRDGYIALKDRFDNNYNDKVNVSISILQSNKTYLEKYAGVVILTDVEFNLEKLTATATVEDANFQGAIQGNKSVKTFLNAGITKNGEQTSALTVHNLDYFDAAGVYLTRVNRRAYLLKDALDFLVRFMTDDRVKGIQSLYLNDTSNWEGALPYITTGLSIRLASQDAPNVSFKELITFLQKTHDLTFDFVTDSNDNVIMRIEDSEFFFQSSNTDTIRDITDLKLSIDSNKIASHLEVGNNTSFDSGNCSATTRFFSFQKEDYSLRGKGNIDKLIDLKTDFITDNNVIQEIVVNSSEDFDDDIIIVLGNSAGNQAARFQDTAYCSNNFIYNIGFTNDKIIDRQINSIPNSITKYLTGATTPSKAELGNDIDGSIPTNPPRTAYTDQTQINYTDEEYDLGNNYNTTDPFNTFYDVPFTGNFSFEVSVKMFYRISGINIFEAINGGSTLLQANIGYIIRLQRFDSSLTTLKEQVDSQQIFSLTGLPNTVGASREFVNTISSTMDCDTGDRIRVVVSTVIFVTNIGRVDFTVITDSTDTFFKCLGTSTDAGTYKVFDPNSFRARRYKFEKNLSLTRADNIRSNTRNSIVINELSDTKLDKTVWIEEMVNNIETGETSFTTIN